MGMWAVRKLVKYGVIGTVITASLYSYQANQHVANIGIIRFARAGFTAADISILYKRTIYNSDLDPLSEQFKQMKSDVHTKAANKLLDLCRKNKGVFVKVGQHLGTLEYILPHEYIDVMKELHSRAPTSSIEEVYDVIRKELAEEPSELFVEFDEKPLGTASLAQVHKAKLKDGRVVAVKVQHPFVRGNSIVDMATMEVLVDIASWLFPDFHFHWLVEETKKNIPRELDFCQELVSSVKAKEMYKEFTWLKIPEMYKELSTSRVLTMEYVEGGQVNDFEYMNSKKIDRFEVSDKLGRLYAEMIFRKGYVHSDPHPGNILVQKKENGVTYIVLIDHGLYQTLSDSVKFNYSSLWLSLLAGDLAGIQTYGTALGVGKYANLFACMVSGRAWPAIKRGITSQIQTKEELEHIQDKFPDFLSEMTRILQNVNRELLLILKTNDLLRGIEHSLKTHSRMSSYLVMSRSCIFTIYNDRIKNTSSLFRKTMLTLKKRWLLLQVTVYYFYLSLKTSSLGSAIRDLKYI